MQRRNNIFELVTVAPIFDVNQCFGAVDNFDEEAEGTRLRLRGNGKLVFNIMLKLTTSLRSLRT